MSSVENYNVFIDVDIHQEATKYDFLIADEFFQDILQDSGTPVFWVRSQENFKTLGQVESICEAMKSSAIRRTSKIAAIGGGIVQDLATLAASIYMRGVKWSYFPTTLTGMADSCLGGKSSINVGGIKNLVGNVFPPAAIFVDLSFAKTLSVEATISGLAEAVKICFARGPEAFENFLTNPTSRIADESGGLASLIELSLASKKWFIEKDEFDVAERQLLNFGHSFGHALETACNFRIQHGVGVAIGMMAALHHPATALSQATADLEKYLVGLLAPLASQISNLPQEMDWGKFSLALASDKKNSATELCLILPGLGGSLEKIMLPYEAQAIEDAVESLRRAFELLIKSGENNAR
jgi:3-dehydroquinate synthase